MKKIRASLIGLALLPVVLLAACGEDVPFSYRYTSPSVVEVGYQGKNYVLQRFGPRTATPFEYAFEPDGDLDITINGKTWDIDSPYDRDTKKKTKKTVKKSSTNKK